MTHSWTFGRKLAAGFAFAGLALAVIAVSGYRVTLRLSDNVGWVAHTQQVRADIASLSSLMKDAETGQRGYVITGDENYLEPHRAALPMINDVFADVRRLTADNSNQQRRLDAIRPLIDDKLSELKLTIDLRRERGFEATMKRIQEGRGKKSMDEFRRILVEMDQEEQELLRRRSDEASASSRTARSVILWGSILGALLVTVVGLAITRSVAEQVGSAVQHVQSSSSELQAAASQQATSMNEISTTISELLATSRQIAESAQRVARIASETAQAAGGGDMTVQKAQSSIDAIRRQVDAIVTHMLDLGKKSQQIGGILEIINELAEQTNILSINASVEAAGAGEAGRRFAVVADEIRKLADRVGGSTKDIRALIDEVRAAVNTTVMATEGGAKAVEAGGRQFVEVASAFQRISGLVGTSTEAAREIELSTKQQSTAVEQVNTAISTVAQTAKESETSLSQTLQTAAQLTTLSKDLARLIQASNGRN